MSHTDIIKGELIELGKKYEGTFTTKERDTINCAIRLLNDLNYSEIKGDETTARVH